MWNLIDIFSIVEKLIETSGDVTAVNDKLSGLHLSAVILSNAPPGTKGCFFNIKIFTYHTTNKYTLL